eukprot:7213362-Pyramimonas_sp.AAC.1
MQPTALPMRGGTTAFPFTARFSWTIRCPSSPTSARERLRVATRRSKVYGRASATRPSTRKRTSRR